jgi:hypothetical protein
MNRPQASRHSSSSQKQTSICLARNRFIGRPFLPRARSFTLAAGFWLAGSLSLCCLGAARCRCCPAFARVTLILTSPTRYSLSCSTRSLTAFTHSLPRQTILASIYTQLSFVTKQGQQQPPSQRATPNTSSCPCRSLSPARLARPPCISLDPSHSTHRLTDFTKPAPRATLSNPTRLHPVVEATIACSPSCPTLPVCRLSLTLTLALPPTTAAA